MGTLTPPGQLCHHCSLGKELCLISNLTLPCPVHEKGEESTVEKEEE